jgi:YD repeat-containing protein
VICVAFSPDGQRLAAQGDDGPIRILDSHTPEGEGRTFRQASLPRNPAFTPDGGRVVALDLATNLPQAWDAVSGHRLPAPRGGGGRVAYSPDGRWLAAACAEGIRVWDAATYRELRTLPVLPAGPAAPRVIALAFAPNGRLAAATQGTEGAVSVWDAAGGEQLLRFKGHGEFVHALAFRPDGRQLAVVSHGRDQPQGQLNTWDAATGEDLLTVKTRDGFTSGLAYSPDGRLLATTDPGAVRLRDAATGKEVRSFGDNAEAVAFSPDGRRLAAGGVAHVRVRDLADGKEVYDCQAQGGTAENLAFSPDGRWLAATGLDPTSGVWDMTTGRERPAAEAPAQPGDVGVAFSPDGQWLALGSGDARTVRVVDPATGAEVRTLGGHPGGATCLALSPDGHKAASGGADRVVRLWDANNLEPLRVFRGHTATVLAVAFSPGGRLLASGDQGRFDAGPGGGKGGEVRVWDAAGGQELHRFQGHPLAVLAVAFSADGRQLASVSIEGTVKVWDLATGQELHSGELSFKQKRSNKAGEELVVAFSPDRRALPQPDLPEGAFPSSSWLLAYGSPVDRRIRLWDLAANREAGALTGQGDNRASALAFSPDGRRLAAATGTFSPDGLPVVISGGTIKLWDMVTLQELYAFAHEDGVHSLAFSGDGGRLAAAGSRLVTWDGGPLDDDRKEYVKVEREALGLLDWLFSRPMPRQEILERLRAHPAISEPVRQRALELAAHFREEDNPRPEQPPAEKPGG